VTYPNFTFPPGTPLYPGHSHIHAYHASFVSHFKLAWHIYLNHTVLSTTWAGNASHGYWDVESQQNVDGSETLFHKRFDHVIVANGHNHYPYSPTWEGVEGWLENTPPGYPKREISHSIYYREPDKYRGRTVVVVGGSASGRDCASKILPSARKVSFFSIPSKLNYNIDGLLKVYHSVNPNPLLPVPPGTVLKPRISHFTNSSIVFTDGTSTLDADSVILATGYEMRVPFLSAGNALTIDPTARSPLNSSAETGRLITNLRYLRPLYKQILSLSSEFPMNALYFVGLPIRIANCPSDVAQAIFINNTILDPSLLPPRSELLAELRMGEDELRRKGYDPDYIGHRLVDDVSSGSDYQDGVVQWLRERGARVPVDEGSRYVEPWRRWVGENVGYLRNGWTRVDELGEGEIQKWVDRVETEEDWVRMMHKLVEWKKEKETEEGLSAPSNWLPDI
jgi:hypothetical protein